MAESTEAKSVRNRRPSVIRLLRGDQDADSLERLRTWFNETYPRSLPISVFEWELMYWSLRSKESCDVNWAKHRVHQKIAMDNPKTKAFYDLNKHRLRTRYHPYQPRSKLDLIRQYVLKDHVIDRSL